MAKNKGGRPTLMTDITIAKLEQAFAIDCSVEEACSYADISRDCFYDHLKINPAFSDRIADLRQRPVLKARQTVVQKIGENYSNAMDYLKRKKKLEFGDSTDITSGGEKIDSISYVIPNGKNTND
jgi:predicted DNA-binding protein YlxM (UPF0122 family)